MSEAEKIALIDMDGTIADYEKALVRDLQAMKAPEEDNFDIYGFNPQYIENRMDAIKRQPGWWKELEEIEAGMKVVDIIKNIGFETHILTKGPSSKSQAWAEKVEWVREKLPGTPITITEDKGLVYGRVLYDDYSAYVKRWLEWRPRGLVLMNENNENRSFDHPNVFKIDTKTFPTDAQAWRKLRERLEEAYNR